MQPNIIKLALVPSVLDPKKWILRKGDGETTFRSEVSRCVEQYQTRKDFFSLGNDIMIVSYKAGIDPLAFCRDSIQVLKESVLRWSSLVLEAPSGGDDAVPAVLTATDRRTLLSIARNMRILPPVFLKRVALYTAAVLLPVCVLAAWYLHAHASLHLPLAEQLKSLLADFSFRVDSFVLALLGAMSTAIVIRTMERRDGKTLDKIARACRAGSVANKSRDNNAPGLIARIILNMDKPIALFVPSYAALDAATREALRDILNVPDGRYIGNVLWVVMESEAERAFSTTLAEEMRRREDNTPKPALARAA